MYSAPEAAEPLASVHTHTFAPLLAELGISLAVSTYQAGKLILVRADGERVNTHFRDFRKPMGLAWRPGHLAIGCAAQVWHYRDLPAAAARAEPPGRHDACWIPRACHVTGDVDIHELAWAGEQLWFVNTRFSTLCTLDPEYSFVPRWRPPFVTAIAPEDRCHLNGLALRDGRPRYVTALGMSDAPQGWRERKADGGMLMDLDGDRLLLTGLSMPHSPRWHDGQLWLLESGRGALARLDGAGRPETVATVPGFARGLALVGPVAFIGLSFVRESALFSGIPITLSGEPQQCGVWAVHLPTGRTLGFLRFESGVREIFAVEALPSRFPELVDVDDPLAHSSYALPDAALAAVPAGLRS